MLNQCFHCGRPLDTGFNCPVGHSQVIVPPDETHKWINIFLKDGQPFIDAFRFVSKEHALEYVSRDSKNYITTIQLKPRFK